MTIVAVDGDRKALERTARSLRSVFAGGDVVTCADALSAYQYCVNHASEISLVFLSVILKPFDGLKLRELISTLPIPLSVVFTLKEKCGELLELVTANGACRHIVKPVTPEKVAAVAQDLIAGCWADGEGCENCAFFWCEKQIGRETDEPCAKEKTNERGGSP